MFFVVTNLFIVGFVGKMTDASDDESVSHVSNSFSNSDEMCDSPTFSELEEACRQLDELAEMYEPPPQAEEEDTELYLAKEEAYRS